MPDGTAITTRGRARIRRLHPLTARELGPHFDLPQALRRGLLPSVYFSDDPRADLAAYAGTYLREEIVAVIAISGFYNRWNETMATPLEDESTQFAESHLAQHGWTIGKHAR